MISGSKIGAFSVYFVVNDAKAPNMIPISVPPIETTKKDEEPRTTSIVSIFSEPISANDSNNL